MIENQLSDDTLICRSESLLSNNLGDDIVMMDIEQGSYYGLEAVAARIWDLTENPVSVGSLCESLLSEYDVSKEQCSREVSAFLNDLIERQIIRVVG
jgi:hypothetical protein